LLTLPFVHLVLLLWPLWAVLGLVLLGRLVAWTWEERRLQRSGIREIDAMDGRTFERRLGILFKGLGYRVEPTGSAAGDYGCDLVVSKDGERAVVQAKCWRTNVGVKAVQEAATARAYYKATGAYVVTNRGFSKQAQSLAHANGVVLWGRNELVRALLRTTRGDAPVPPPSEVDGAFCAHCGAAVSDRVRDYCLARRDRFSGLVYCYEHQRTV
jgi:restriction system protein